MSLLAMGFQTVDLGLVVAAELGAQGGFETGFGEDDTLLDLLDEGEMLGQFG